MNGWAAKQVMVSTSKVYGASLTNEPASHEYPITANGSLNCVLKIKSSSVTAGAGITAKLQTAIGNDWVDAKTATIAADGSVYIKLQAAVAGDQAYLPLLNKGRVVLTTGAGSALTVDSIEILQEL